MAGPPAIVLNVLKALALIRCDHLSGFNLLGGVVKLSPKHSRFPPNFFPIAIYNYGIEYALACQHRYSIHNQYRVSMYAASKH